MIKIYNKNLTKIMGLRHISSISNKNNWHDLEWNLIIVKVKTLQDEIVRATEKGDMKTVYEIQRKLITSFEGNITES